MSYKPGVSAWDSTASGDIVDTIFDSKLNITCFNRQSHINLQNCIIEYLPNAIILRVRVAAIAKIKFMLKVLCLIQQIVLFKIIPASNCIYVVHTLVVSFNLIAVVMRPGGGPVLAGP